MERKLHRIEGGNSVVGGVAAGLADYFAIDVAIIRVLFVLGFFTPIPSVIAYIILWVVLPRQFGNSPVIIENSSNNPNPISTMSNSKHSGGQIGGIILVALGSIFLADEFIPWFDFDKLWPMILIAIGVYILTKDKKTEEKVTETYKTEEKTDEPVPSIVEEVLNKDVKSKDDSSSSI
jgi:phage shock protein C